MDYGHRESDRKLKALERKLDREYKRAYKELKAKADAYFKRFEEKDKDKLQALNSGKITESDYLSWRNGQMATGRHWEALVTSLAESMTKTNEIAMSMIDDNLSEVFALNANYGAYEICKGMNANLSFELVDKKTVQRLLKDNPKLLPKPRVNIPKDERWNKQKMRSALLQGILQGESVPKIANRLQQVTNMNRSASIRNARTMITGAENAGRTERYSEAEEMGIELEKEWLATLDDRTRDSHILLDGVSIPNDEPFDNGLMFPGDPAGEPEEVYNCRCTLVCKIKGKQYDDKRISKLGDMTYEEWKDGAKKH